MITNLSKVTLFANLRTRQRSGKSRESSEFDSEASTAITILESETWGKRSIRRSGKVYQLKVALYTTPSAPFGSTDALDFFEVASEETLASILARSPGLNILWLCFK